MKVVQIVQQLLHIDLKTNLKYILLVPDSLFWVTGRIAREISNVLIEKGANPLICSGPVLSKLLAIMPDFVNQIQIVHFLTPHLATNFKDFFYDKCIFISTIHHIENAQSVEPSLYSDAIMTVSRQWHNELEQSGIPKSKLVMIQNGIDVDLFHPVSNDEKLEIRRKYGLPLNKFVIGFSAKKTSDSCDRKGIDVLESIIKLSSVELGSNITWFIRGPGWDYLIEHFQKQGIDIYYCHFLESDNSLAESYQALDAFVITSRIEGGPVTLLEAMSCGLPVITTKVGVSLEIIDNYVNGFFVNFNDPLDILSKLKYVISNSYAMTRLGVRARETIVSKLQWKYTTKEILKLYLIAEDTFKSRSKCISKTSQLFQAQFESKFNIKRWIYSRECTYFASFLESQKAHKAAIKMANSAIAISPFDLNILRSTLHLSSLRVLFQFLQRIYRYLVLDR